MLSNCQYFVETVLSGSGLITPELSQFAVQKEVAGSMTDSARQGMKTITDVAAVARTVMGAIDGKSSARLKDAMKERIGGVKNLAKEMTVTAGKRAVDGVSTELKAGLSRLFKW